MNERNKNVTVRTCGFSTLLTIALIVLKLCGVISWSWIWVLAPLWISFLIGVAIFVFALWFFGFFG